MDDGGRRRCWRDACVATRSRSPVEPTTSGTPGGHAGSGSRCDRLSSTTTFSPASSKLVHHVAADIAGAAGDQDRHVARSVRISGMSCAPKLQTTGYDRRASNPAFGAAFLTKRYGNSVDSGCIGSRHAMADILFIKTSSLGDVIHHMPALTEARRAAPGRALRLGGGGGLRAAGAAASGGRHGRSPVAWRRWRKSLWSPATLRRDRRQPARHPRASATTRSSTARACCARR